MIMSLFTLTFGNTSSAQRGAAKGRVKVLKTDQFFGTEEVCVIGKLVEGAVAREMLVPGTSKKIVSVESNYGEGVCNHKGAQVVLMVSDSDKEEYSVGEEISFEKVQMLEESAKPKGKLIIA